MGREARLNIGIKNDRIKILERRADMVEALLSQRIEIFIKLATDVKKELEKVQEGQELIYEELMARTLRGRMKRLTAWLGRKSQKGKKK